MSKKSDDIQTELLKVGWREWASLPGLGIPAIKVKIDTGAKTSALHAFEMETFTKDGISFVRFLAHPLQRNNKVGIPCELPILEERVVKSSNGQKERRITVMTPIRIGHREWDIELTLTNRDLMSYRMLLGRQAMSQVIVFPTSSFLQGKQTK
jgi:hypothetical protein